jgi:hypothetical protein
MVCRVRIPPGLSAKRGREPNSLEIILKVVWQCATAALRFIPRAKHSCRLAVILATPGTYRRSPTALSAARA